jgi:hypothetical protein
MYVPCNAYFNSIGTPHCPRKAFLQDLSQAITHFLEEGNNIILMLDGNTKYEIECLGISTRILLSQRSYSHQTWLEQTNL